LRVYRLAKDKRGRYRVDDLSGNGAAISGGRWNLRGTRALYTSANASTAVLETRVHATGILPLKNFFLVTIEVLDHLIDSAHEPSLPPDWNQVGTIPRTTLEIAEAWITQASTLVMKVPSLVCPADFNYILNPRHPDMDLVSVVSVETFALDPRLFR
jgi:RES domain-containing protein